MPDLAAYTLMIPDPQTGEPVERVHTVNPWHKTSAEGVFPETWNMWPRERETGQRVRFLQETESGFLTRIAETYVPALTTLTPRAVCWLASTRLIVRLPPVGVPVPVHRRIAEHLAAHVDPAITLERIPYVFVQSDALLPLRRWRYRDRLSADPLQPHLTITSHVWECCWRLRGGRVVVDLEIAQRRRRYELLLMRDGKLEELTRLASRTGKRDRAAVEALYDLDDTLAERLAEISDLDVLSKWLPPELGGADEQRTIRLAS